MNFPGKTLLIFFFRTTELFYGRKGNIVSSPGSKVSREVLKLRNDWWSLTGFCIRERTAPLTDLHLLICLTICEESRKQIALDKGDNNRDLNRLWSFSPGMRVNTTCINSTRCSSSKKDSPLSFRAHSKTQLFTKIRQPIFI